MNQSSSGSFRPDIQGLRAVAVFLVLIYHIWPQYLPGGYVGVDVFFVISGYLITSLLAKELERDGSISLSGFYARRVRRLLPASLLTLGLVGVATIVLLPVTSWNQNAGEIMASSLYLENWWLAFKSVDYLAIDRAPSPVQHFWSLSVEEQFYIFWPAMMIACFALTRRWYPSSRFKRVLAAGMMVVVMLSLTWSIVSAYRGNLSAYFSTFTRIWQLAIGGTLAMVHVHARWKPRLLLAAGLIAILVSAFIFSDQTVYPGAVALLPTLGGALVIAGGIAWREWIATRWLGSRPVQYVGDISYSLYLVHWPLIVIAKAVMGTALAAWQGWTLLFVSILLAALSKHYVEDRYRPHVTAGQPRVRRTLVIAAVSSMICAGLAYGMGRYSTWDSAGGQNVATDYPGAAVLFDPAVAQGMKPRPFLPALGNVEGDVATAYAEGCIQNIKGVDVKRCNYGPDDALVKIAIVGDSHAVHWLPALQALAEQDGIKVVGITKTSCNTSGLAPDHAKLGRPYDECAEWTRNVVAYLNHENFDRIILSQSPKHYVAGMRDKGSSANAQMIAEAMAKTWGGLKNGKEKLLLIRPTPWQRTLVRECVAQHPDAMDQCTGERSTVLQRDAMVRLAGITGYKIMDFTDLFCAGKHCPAVVGNVFVYRDAHHITATYMRTIAPELGRRLGLPEKVGAGTAAATQHYDMDPTPANARDDKGPAFAQGCVLRLQQAKPRECIQGDPKGVTRVVVVGDATVANLAPALDEAGRRKGWRVEIQAKESCLVSRIPVANRKLGRSFNECLAWANSVVGGLTRRPPDLVLFAQSPQYTDKRSHTPADAAPILARGVSEHLRTLQRAGAKVAVIGYTPWFPFDVPQCLLKRSKPESCDAARELVLRGGALALAQKGTDGVGMVDLSSEFCGPTTCPPVKDGTLIYRDVTQPTATFARTLSHSIERQIEGELKKQSSR